VLAMLVLYDLLLLNIDNFIDSIFADSVVVTAFVACHSSNFVAQIDKQLLYAKSRFTVR